MQWIFHGKNLDNMLNGVYNVVENVDVDKMIDVLNEFRELTIGASEIKDDDVEQGTIGSGQYYDKSFRKMDIDLYPVYTKFSFLNCLVKLMHLKVLEKMD